MAKIAMTDLAVKALQPPPKGQKTYWSKDLTGFGVRVSQGGAKTFVALDPRSKIRIQQTVGRYPLIDLKTARSAAKRLLAEAVLGKTQTPSVGWNTALERYLAEVKEKRKPRTYADYYQRTAEVAAYRRRHRASDSPLQDSLMAERGKIGLVYIPGASGPSPTSPFFRRFFGNDAKREEKETRALYEELASQPNPFPLEGLPISPHVVRKQAHHCGAWLAEFCFRHSEARP